MQAGFTCYEAGFVQSKNVISVSIENLLSFMITVVVFTLVGFPLMYGKSVYGLFGSGFWFLQGIGSTGDAGYAHLFIQIMFAAVAVTIFAGAMSERTKLSALLIASVVTAALIYPVFGHWVWGGKFLGDSTWLQSLGYIDFAGATVVHTTAGFVALAGLIAVGPRKETKAGKSNIPLATLGVFILWFGWLGFNGGNLSVLDDRLGLVFLNTTLSAAFGMLGALAVNQIFNRKGRYLISIFNGVLAGLVAITALSAYCHPIPSMAIGFIAGMAADLSMIILERYRIDDVISAVPTHLVGGVVGCISVAAFADMDYLTCSSRIEQLGVQTLGIMANFAWAFGLASLMFFIIDKTIGLRVSDEEEKKGLNIVEFNDIYSWENYIETSYYEKEIQNKNKLLRKQTSLLTVTEAQEKENLAKELHDGLGQSLAALKLILNMNKKKISQTNDGKLINTASKALELTEHSIQEMRNVLNDLKPEALEKGIENGLQYMADSLSELEGFQCTLDVRSPMPDFDETVSLNLYRLVQEALTNVVKHAYADEAVIICRAKDEDAYIFEVRDNGNGFDVSNVNYGVGISSMTDRVKMLGGDIKIVSEIGKGTSIILEVPAEYE